MLRYGTLCCLVALAALAFTAAGCSPTDNSAAPAKADAAPPAKDDAHAHKPGTHGDSIIAIGTDSYHAEAIFEKNGVLRLYTLGADETKVLEVEADDLGQPCADVRHETLPYS